MLVKWVLNIVWWYKCQSTDHSKIQRNVWIVYVAFLQPQLLNAFPQPFENFGFYYISRIWGGRDCTPPPWYLRFYVCHEVEAYTRDRPWKKNLIDDVINHVTWLVCISQTKNYFCWHQKKMADDVIIQLLWSKWFSTISFDLIACLEPVKQDGHYFHAEILVCKFPLGSIKACLHMRKRFCRQIFFMPKCSQGNFVHWEKVSCKTIRGYGGI